MQAELRQFFKPKAQNAIKRFLADGVDLDSDEELFVCYDERYEDPHPVPITGKIAKERLAEEHYRIEHIGKNSQTKMQRAAIRNRKAADEQRKAVEKMKQDLAKMKAGDHLEKVEKDDKITVKPKKTKKSVVIE